MVSSTFNPTTLLYPDPCNRRSSVCWKFSGSSAGSGLRNSTSSFEAFAIAESPRLVCWYWSNYSNLGLPGRRVSRTKDRPSGWRSWTRMSRPKSSSSTTSLTGERPLRRSPCCERCQGIRIISIRLCVAVVVMGVRTGERSLGRSLGCERVIGMGCISIISHTGERFLGRSPVASG
jgi:hypothetical protein